MADDTAQRQLRRLLVKGRRFRIYVYRAADGSAPLLVAIDRLRDQQKAMEGAYAARWRQAGEDGLEALKGDHYHKWTKKMDKRLAGTILGAFKDLHSKTRIPIFSDGQGTLICTHLIEGKKEDALDTKEVTRALEIRADYFERKIKVEEELAKASAPKEGRARGRR